MRGTRLQPVEVDGEDPPFPTEPGMPKPSREVGMLLLALKSLSQRAIVAARSIADVVMAGSVFALAWRVSLEPSPYQLGLITLYGLFILAALRIIQR